MILRQVLWHGDRFYDTERGLCRERGFIVRRQVLWHEDRLDDTETCFVALKQLLWHEDTNFVSRRQDFLLELWFSPASIIPRSLRTHSFNYHGRHTI
jgi:hypothetical protein